MTWKLPAGSETGHVAVLGKTGSGKTYAAKAIVEGLLDGGAQVCIIDPTSAWWGLRLAADGKRKAYERVVLLGGPHCDLPLPASGGRAVARLITGQGASVVIDTGAMSVGEYTRFFFDFAQELYATVKSPLHLIIDEAHQFMPQGGGGRMDVEAGKMLHAGNRLMSGGRSRGIRAMLITQRPAKLHKDALTCADTLIAMRVIAPQDREAIREWVEGSDDSKRAKEVLTSLAGLQRGQGWVWYPEGGYLERITFPKITTYDSSKTPDGTAQQPHVGAIELGEVSKALEEAMEEAKANDPKALKARIAELEAKLGGTDSEALAEAHSREETLREQAEQAMRERDAANKRCAELEAANRQWATICGELRSVMLDIESTARNAEADSRNTPDPLPASVPGIKSNAEPTVRSENGSLASVRDRDAGTTTRPHGAGDRTPRPVGAGPTGPQQRLLDAIAWWNAAAIWSPTRIQVGHVAGYTATSGTFRTLLSTARTAGLIEYRGDALTLTPAGRKRCSAIARPITRDHLHAMVRERLSGPQARVFTLLISRGGQPTGRTEVAERCGYEVTSGTFRTLMSSIVSLGIAIYPSKTTIAAAGWLFPKGMR